ncbi:MAG: PIN domain nuclease [Pseudomonadales bacterium]
MIIVDTSVWIDFFNGKDTAEVIILDRALGTEAVAIGDLIALEILQGFKNDKDYTAVRGMLDALTIYDMLGENAAYACADNYRMLRKKGITVRKSADVIIATFCIENNFPLLFSDKDFIPFVEHLGLRAVSAYT